MVANLLVAKGVPALADLDIQKYAAQVDAWADAFRCVLPQHESNFAGAPHQFKNDIRFFRLVILHWFLDETVGVAYREDQRDISSILYTDPSDLFLHGVIDTRRGTCGNLSALFVAICWRLGWPVSLACAGSHFIARYDDGEVTHNVEATTSGKGGCRSDPDDFLVRERRISGMAVATGSDLAALTPRQTLGVTFGLRARHFRDTARLAEAESDYLLARYLFPQNHYLYRNAVGTQVLRGAEMFAWGEDGHPSTLAEDLTATYPPAASRGRHQSVTLPFHGDLDFGAIAVG